MSPMVILQTFIYPFSTFLLWKNLGLIYLFVVGHLARCRNNSIVNSLKQEAPFEVDVNDLVIQEALPENLKK